MAKTVLISKKTKEITSQLKSLALTDFVLPDFLEDQQVELVALSNWLADKQEVDDSGRYLLESLYASLLTDLRKSMTQEQADEPKEPAGWGSKVKFVLLLIAGTIFFGCEGYDGISGILSVFSMSPLVMVLISFLFSGLSITVFYSFDLFELAQNLGIELKSAPKIIDCYLQQIEEIKAILKVIDDCYIRKSEEELGFYLQILADLTMRFSELQETQNRVKKSLDRPALKIARAVGTFITGLLFFSNGFLAGQTVALSLAALIVSSATPAMWPVILASTIVALCALIIYWYIVHPEIDGLIGRWMGLDKEKIDRLCDTDDATQQEKKLLLLQDNITGQIQLLQHTQSLTEQVSNVCQRLSLISRPSHVVTPPQEESPVVAQPVISKVYFDKQQSKLKRSSSCESFFKRTTESPSTTTTKEETAQLQPA